MMHHRAMWVLRVMARVKGADPALDLTSASIRYISLSVPLPPRKVSLSASLG